MWSNFSSGLTKSPSNVGNGWMIEFHTLVKLRKFADFWPSYFIHWPSSVDPDTDSATNQSDGFTVSHPSLPSFVNKNGDPARVDS